MSDQTTVLAPPGRAPVRCTGCGHTMAADQKYCLECGRRKGDPRVDFNDYMTDGKPVGPVIPAMTSGEPPSEPPPADPASVPADDRPEREVTPLMAAAGLAAFAIILLLGVTIGRLGGGSDTPQIVAATGTPTTAAAPAPTTGSTQVDVSFQADWPEGKEGWTVEIATLSKASADPAAVEATKADLAARGAPEVGVLDSDEFASLPPGNYVFYSGVHDTKGAAQGELKALKASFPEAQVVKVGSEAVKTGGSADSGGGGSLVQGEGQQGEAPVEASTEELEALNNDASAEEFQELQQKLPPTIETPGKAPPKDDKAPGAGGPGAVEIG